MFYQEVFDKTIVNYKMIVKPYELDKIENDFKIFLFYGKNEGLKKLYISGKNKNVVMKEITNQKQQEFHE